MHTSYLYVLFATNSDAPATALSEKTEGKKGGEKAEKTAAKESKEALTADADDADQPTPVSLEERLEKRLEEGVGIPHLVIDASAEKINIWQQVLDMKKLPSLDEVLDGLGMGSRGPPIPPPASFAVVPYPVKRHAPPGAEGGHYVFIASSPDDPYVAHRSHWFIHFTFVLSLHVAA